MARTPPGCGNANRLMSRYDRWKKDGTIDEDHGGAGVRTNDGLRTAPPAGLRDDPAREVQADDFNPWLFDRDDDTDLGKLSKQWGAGKR